MRCWRRAILAVFLLACTSCAAPQLTREQAQAPADVFEIAKPAVVVVATDTAVTWSVPEVTMTPEKQRQLVDRVVAMALARKIGTSEEALARAAADLILGDPGAWLSPAAERFEDTVHLSTTGSGFFISEDGYLLTNAHVVREEEAEVRKMLVAEIDRESKDPELIGRYRDELSKELQVPASDAQARNLLLWTVDVYKSDLRLRLGEPVHRLGFGVHTAREVLDSGISADVVEAGEVTPGRDVAVLKAAGTFPSLALAGGGLPANGVRLNVVGYPCRCSPTEPAAPDQQLEAVHTQGRVRGQLEMPGGWSAMEVDAAMQHGNSGGPVLDDRGRVVGLATFGEERAAGAGVGHNYAVPVGVARPFIDKARARPSRGRLTPTYARAMTEFRAQRYRAALPLFQDVSARTTHNAYVGQYIERSRREIQAGHDRTPPDIVYRLPYVLAGLYLTGAAAALAIGLLAVVRHRRRRTGRAAALPAG